MGRRGAPDKKNLYVVFCYSFFKAGAQSGCVLIAVNNSVSNKPTTAPAASTTRVGHQLVTPVSDSLCCLCVRVCICLLCGLWPIDSSCKCRPVMMPQLPSASTCQGARWREKRIWTCWFLSGKSVKYVDSEGLFSTSLPHCCAGEYLKLTPLFN